MSSVALLVVAIAVLPAFGLAAWVWLTLAGENDDLQTFAGIEGLHFDD